MGNDILITAEPPVHLPIIVDEDFSVEDDAQINDTQFLLAGAAPALFPKWSPAPVPPWSSLGTPTSLSTAAANNTLAFEGAAAGGASVSALTYLGLFVAAAGIGYGIGRGIRYVYDNRYNIEDWWHEATYKPLDLTCYEKKFEAKDRLRRNDPLHIDAGGKSWEELQDELEKFQRKLDEYIARWNEMARQTLLRTNGRTWVPTEIPELWAQLFSSDSKTPADPSQFTLTPRQGAARASIGSSTGLMDPEEKERVRLALLRLATVPRGQVTPQQVQDLDFLRRLAITPGTRINHPAVSAAFRELENHSWQFEKCLLWNLLSENDRVDLARRFAENRARYGEPQINHNRRSQLIRIIAQTLPPDTAVSVAAPQGTHLPVIDQQTLESIRSALTDQQRRTWDRLKDAFPNGGTDPVTRIIGDRAGDLSFEIYRIALISLVAVLLNALEIYLRRNNIDSVQKMRHDPFLKRWFEPNHIPEGVVSGRAVPSLLGPFGVRGGLNRLLGAIYEFRGQARMRELWRSYEPTPTDQALTDLLGQGARINPDGLYRGRTRDLDGTQHVVFFLVEIKSMTGMQPRYESFMDPWMWRIFRGSGGIPQGKALRQFLRTASAMRSHPNVGWHLILITNRGRGMTQEQQVRAAREHLAHALMKHGYSEAENTSIMNRVRVTVLTTAPPPVRGNGQAK